MANDLEHYLDCDVPNCERCAEIERSDAAAPAPQAEPLGVCDHEPLKPHANRMYSHFNDAWGQVTHFDCKNWRLRAGAAPAETAGEMTADAFWKPWMSERVKGAVPKLTALKREFAEAYANQRLQPIEQELAIERIKTTVAHKALLPLIQERDALRAKVADLEREQLQKALDRSTSPCGHLAQYAKTEDGGKHITCLECEESELREMRERVIEECALEINRLAKAAAKASDEGVPMKHTIAAFCDARDYVRLLARKAGS